MFSTPQLELIRILPPSNINGMSFSHSQPLYSSCTPTPLGKIFSPTFHKLTGNNSTRSTKPWVLNNNPLNTLAKLMPKTYKGMKPLYLDSTKSSR